MCINKTSNVLTDDSPMVKHTRKLGRQLKILYLTNTDQINRKKNLKNIRCGTSMCLYKIDSKTAFLC